MKDLFISRLRDFGGKKETDFRTEPPSLRVGRGFIFLIFFFLVLPLANDPDLGSHLKIGQFILEKKTVLSRDILSFSFPDYPYQYHSWGAEVIMAKLYEKFSFLGLSLFFGLVSCLGIFILYKLTITKKTSFLPLIVIPPFISLIFRSISVRPRAFSFLFYCLLVYIFISYRRDKNSKLINFIPLIFFFWANLHGGFLVGLLMVLLFLGFETIEKFLGSRIVINVNSSTSPACRPASPVSLSQGGPVSLSQGGPNRGERGREETCLWRRVTIRGIRQSLPLGSPFRPPRGRGETVSQDYLVATKKSLKKIFIIFILSVLACLLNPYGFSVFKTPFEIATNPVNIGYNLEWLPLTKREMGNIALGAIFVGFLYVLAVLRLKFDRLLLYFATIFFMAALFRNRNILPFLVFFLPLLIGVLSSFENKFFNFFKKVNQEIKITLFAYFFLFIICILARMTINTFQVIKVSFDPAYFASSAYYPYPYQAILYLQKHQVGNRMFNNVNWGGYLTLNFNNKKVFANGLMDVYKVDKNRFFFEDYLAMINLRPNWEKLLEKYEIDSAFLSTKDPLAQGLKIHDNWVVLYEDEITLIFQKQ